MHISRKKEDVRPGLSVVDLHADKGQFGVQERQFGADEFGEVGLFVFIGRQNGFHRLPGPRQNLGFVQRNRVAQPAVLPDSPVELAAQVEQARLALQLLGAALTPASRPVRLNRGISTLTPTLATSDRLPRSP